MGLNFRKLFSIDEVEQSPYLQTLYWVLLPGLVFSLGEWFRSDHIVWRDKDLSTQLCPTYYQNCTDLFFWNGLTTPFFREYLYFVIFTVIALSAAAAAFRRWVPALMLLIPIVAYKIFYLYALSYKAVVEYEMFHLPVLIILIFAGRKEYFAPRVFLLSYVFAATMKFSETWIAGTYFSALIYGLPIFPDSLIPFITNGVIIFEIFSPWLLLSRNDRIRLAATGAWALFHLYSFMIVSVAYPFHCLPVLLGLCLKPPPEATSYPRFSRKDAFGWSFLALLLALAVVPWFVPGDKLYPVQARRFGVQMFDANHQCSSEEIVITNSGRSAPVFMNYTASNVRCGPYPQLHELKRRCAEPNVKAIEWRFFSSINGGPFYRLVNTENACKLTYNDFGRNDWVTLPEEGAPIAGYARKNSMGAPVRRGETSIIQDSPDPSMRSPLQEKLISQVKALEIFYWTLWIAAALYFLARHFLRARGSRPL